jgi:hypothetical protein
MIQFALLLSVFFSINSLAQSPRIVSLYERDALVTGRFLPFKVYSDQGLSPNAVVISEGCDGMVDPHRAEIFHLFCFTEGEKIAQVTFSNGEKMQVGPVDVRKLSLLGPGDIIDRPTPVNRGRDMFRMDCRGCHISQPIPKPQTVESLQSALSRVPMSSSGLHLKYNDDLEALQALLTYINEEL